MSESKFKREFRHFLKQYNFRVHPIENKIVAGMPDLLIMQDGFQPIWIELKTQTIISPNQLRWIRNNPRERVLMAKCYNGKIVINQMRRITLLSNDVGGWHLIFEGNWPLELKDEPEIISLILREMV